MIVKSSNKYIPVLIIWLLLSCSRRSDTVYDTYFEILKGEVKTLSEVYSNHNGNEIKITYFNEEGIAANMVEIGGTCDKCELRFSYKYENDGRKKQVIMTGKYGQQPYTCDSNGRIAEEKFDTKDYDFDKEDFAKKKDIFKYDAKGYLKESASYDDTVCTYFTTYKYNKFNLLVETDEFTGGMREPYITVFYKYPSLDDKGNWLKRVSVLTYHIVVNSKMQETVSRDTVTRKIAYY